MGLGQRVSRLILTMLLIFSGSSVSLLSAQDKTSAKSFSQPSGNNQPFSTQTWQKASKNLDYTEKPDLTSGVKKPKTPKVRFKYLKEALFTIVIAILAGLILFVVLSKMKQAKRMQPAGTGIEPGAGDNLPPGMLIKRYKEALSEENYRLALRYYHLLVLQSLAARRVLKLSREKTNRAYLYELRTSEWHDTFREITRYMEAAWFGNWALHRDDFMRVTAPFNTFIPFEN